MITFVNLPRISHSAVVKIGHAWRTVSVRRNQEVMANLLEVHARIVLGNRLNAHISVSLIPVREPYRKYRLVQELQN